MAEHITAVDWRGAYHRVTAGYAQEFERNRRLHGDRIQCRKGCDDCCHQLFQISELEAAEVSRALHALPHATRLRLRQRAQHYLEARAALAAARGIVESWGTLAPPGSRLPCPALERGACLIYDHRPLICRKFGIPLWNPDRPGRVYACQLNFRDGEQIHDDNLIQIQTALHQEWKNLQARYNDAAGYRHPEPLTVARAILEDCSAWFPPAASAAAT